MFLPIRYGMAQGFFLGSLLGLSGCFDASAEDTSAGTGSAKPAYVYTTDLSPWGPHPETSLKQFVTEPRWMKLLYAEQQKLRFCSRGSNEAERLMIEVSLAEYTIDTTEYGGGPSRLEPVGVRAKEYFREEITRGLRSSVWPLPHRHGHEIAAMYGRHFGYQYWQEGYQVRLPVGSSDYSGQLKSIQEKINEQFWPRCLEQVPTACFEKAPAHPGRCLAGLIHPKEFPAFEEVTDLYMERMVKPNGW